MKKGVTDLKKNREQYLVGFGLMFTSLWDFVFGLCLI